MVGIEVNERLVDWARQNVQKHDGDLFTSGILEILAADGWRGWPARAPYDAIHVGAAAESTVLRTLHCAATFLSSLLITVRCPGGTR